MTSDEIPEKKERNLDGSHRGTTWSKGGGEEKGGCEFRGPGTGTAEPEGFRPTGRSSPSMWGPQVFGLEGDCEACRLGGGEIPRGCS